MTLRTKACLLPCLLLLLATLATPARADRYCNNALLGLWGNYAYNGFHHHVNRQTIPYFALHPPVYYSHIVARPYGWSPYALPPGVRPAELKEPTPPQEIINPHYKPKQEAAPQKEEKKARKLKKKKAVNRTAVIIENPFYRPARARTVSRSLEVR